MYGHARLETGTRNADRIKALLGGASGTNNFFSLAEGVPFVESLFSPADGGWAPMTGPEEPRSWAVLPQTRYVTDGGAPRVAYLTQAQALGGRFKGAYFLTPVPAAVHGSLYHWPMFVQ
jgi:hypothetical protein